MIFPYSIVLAWPQILEAIRGWLRTLWCNIFVCVFYLPHVCSQRVSNFHNYIQKIIRAPKPTKISHCRGGKNSTCRKMLRYYRLDNTMYWYWSLFSPIKFLWLFLINLIKKVESCWQAVGAKMMICVWSMMALYARSPTYATFATVKQGRDQRNQYSCTNQNRYFGLRTTLSLFFPKQGVVYTMSLSW